MKEGGQNSLYRWSLVMVAIVTLVMVVGFALPAFSPPETSHGPRCEWWEPGNRQHMVEQFAMSLGSLMLGTVIFVILGRHGSKDRKSEQEPSAEPSAPQT